MRADGTPDFRLTARAPLTLATEADPAAGPDADGRFSAVVGATEQVIPRLFYDIVLKAGCADRSLSERGLPSVLYAHDLAGAVIATCEAFEERDNLFVAEATLLIAEDRRVQLAYETWVAMSSRNGDGRSPLREFSIGFDAIDAAWETRGGEEVLAFADIDLFEFSPVLVGAARGTGFLQAPTIDELLERFPRPTKLEAPEPAPDPEPDPDPEPEPDPDPAPAAGLSLEDRRRVASVLFG
ncbi:MAG TPA: hypothetical protein VGJ32_16515 [Solirubrobacteraceae bacterium]